MKTFLFSLILPSFFLSISGHAQRNSRYSYLTVQISPSYDNEEGKSFYRIVAEFGNPNAQAVNDLVWYSSKNKSKGNTVLYSSGNDSAKVVFNYFSSISMALQYLDEMGWELFSINTHINGSDNLFDSKPICYLRRERRSNPKPQ